MKILCDNWGRTLEKGVLVAGDPSINPSEGSECIIRIFEIHFTHPKQYAHLPYAETEGSLYFSDSFDGKCTVGKALHFLDRDVDRCLLNVYLNETCLIRITYRDSTDNVVVRVSFRLRLETILNPTPPPRWDFATKLSYAQSLKEDGVKLVTAHKIIDAFKPFSVALKILLLLDAEELETISEGDKKSVADLKLKLYNNLAHCQLHFQQYEAAKSLCEKALSIDPDNVKALYRRGCSHSGLENWEEAYDDMGRVLALDPNVTEAKAKMKFLKEKVQFIKTAYKKTIQNMFIR